VVGKGLKKKERAGIIDETRSQRRKEGLSFTVQPRDRYTTSSEAGRLEIRTGTFQALVSCDGVNQGSHGSKLLSLVVRGSEESHCSCIHRGKLWLYCRLQQDIVSLPEIPAYLLVSLSFCLIPLFLTQCTSSRTCAIIFTLTHFNFITLY
jgi:hypothetical protein